jgi:hypothetical protein
MLGFTSLAKVALAAVPLYVTGTLAAASPADTASFHGTVRNIGTLAASSPSDTASFHGTVKNTGTFAAASPHGTAAFSGKVRNIGTLSTSSPADTAVFHGTIKTATLAKVLCAISDYPVVCQAATDANWGV